MDDIIVTNETRPSNDVVFGLIFEDSEIFKITIKCVLGEEIDDSSYVISQKENLMGSAIYNKIRFDVYAEGEKIYTLDMQNGYSQELIRKRLVYYACRAVGGQKVKKGAYDKLKTCVISFIFETNSYDNKNFLTKYYIASDDGKKIRKYSDLLTIVELNLKYYKGTDNENLNILCEFLRIKNNKGLQKFCENHGDGEFGTMLYAKYIKVILDKDIMEEVGKMDLYEEKIQLRYHTVDEAMALQNKKAIEIAKNMAAEKSSVEFIVKTTGLPTARVKKIVQKYNKSGK
jgi:predicted transposase/invertase (TIGR01784 family)